MNIKDRLALMVEIAKKNKAEWDKMKKPPTNRQENTHATQNQSNNDHEKRRKTP